MTGITAYSVCDYPVMYNLFPVEKKECRRRSHETKYQLLIDKIFPNVCKKRHTNLGMTWIDYRKDYDMIPHSWILESLGLVEVSKNIVEFIRNSKICNTNLTSCWEYLANVDIRRYIFQGDSLSPLIFVICMIPLTQILRKGKSGYTFEKNGEKLNHLFFLDKSRIFAKCECEVNGLVSTIQIQSNDQEKIWNNKLKYTCI